jgi:6-phosphogluconolactonase
MKPDVHVLPNAEALARAAAQRVVGILHTALVTRDRATLVLTGGATPKAMYEVIARQYADEIDWKRVDVFWGDERFVPPDHDESNTRMARENLLDQTGISECNSYPFPTTMDDPGMAAEAYEATLRGYFAGRDPHFDLVLFGLGDDGHVASLFPEDSALDEADRWVLHTEAPSGNPVTDRLTMTFPLFNAADNALFLVGGEAKAEAVRDALEGTGDRRPSARIRPRKGLQWYVDEEAATLLSL